MFFWLDNAKMYLEVDVSPNEMRTRLEISNGVSSAPNKDHMQKLRPREVDISTTPIRAHKPFGFSSFGFRVLDFTYVKRAFIASF